VVFKGRETLFEYAVCCFSKKKGSLSPFLTPLFPKTLTTDSIVPILFLVKKFGKKREFEGGNNPFQRFFPPSKFTFFQTNIKSWGITGVQVSTLS